MADENDEELVRRALAGDTQAFASLMRRYEERLFNTVYRLLGSKEDAEDVVQETFINAFQSLRECKGTSRSQFFTWLYRIAYNVAIGHKKHEHGDRPTVRRYKVRQGPFAPESPEPDDTKQIDGQLIAEALRGNDHAYGNLMARYRDALSTMINELLDNPRERMAMRVQLFFRVRESLGRYGGDKPFVSWLHEIAKESVEEFRRNRD
jgi:RNA polymerase sigma factor (sigma-70 family)